MIDPSYFPDHEWRFGDEIRAFYISIDCTNASMTNSMSDTESDSGESTGDDSQTSTNDSNDGKYGSCDDTNGAYDDSNDSHDDCQCCNFLYCYPCRH